MIFNYVYLILIVGMLFILISGIKFISKIIPIKIKLLSLIVFLLLIGKYIVLFGFLFTNNIKYLYLFKPIYFVDMLCIPYLAIISMFIFMRNDKVKFSKLLTICSVFLIAYIFMLLRYEINISLSMNYGYIMYFKESFYPKLMYLIINAVFLLIGVKALNNPRCNKSGFSYIVLASLLTICEIIMEFLKLNFFPENILSQILWVAILIYAIKKLNKK